MSQVWGGSSWPDPAVSTSIDVETEEPWQTILLTEKAGSPGDVPRPDPPEGEHGGVVVNVEEAQLLLVLLVQDDEEAI